MFDLGGTQSLSTVFSSKSISSNSKATGESNGLRPFSTLTTLRLMAGRLLALTPDTVLSFSTPGNMEPPKAFANEQTDSNTSFSGRCPHPLNSALTVSPMVRTSDGAS